MRTAQRLAAHIFAPSYGNGGRGRIRTSVARKERQIYSLLVLATHPPVPRALPGLAAIFLTGELRNAEKARVQRHQPVQLKCDKSARLRLKDPVLSKSAGGGI